MYERKYMISMKGMGDWQPTTPHNPVSVNGLLFYFKQAELHLILKTVNAISDEKFCTSGSQNLLRLVQNLILALAQERYKWIFESSLFWDSALTCTQLLASVKLKSIP